MSSSSTFAPIQLLPLGAIIQSFVVDNINIVQGFPTQALYQKHNDPYFGETIGRIANRIKNGKIDSLNGGQSYNLAINNGPNSLHGGIIGWGKRVWQGPIPIGLRTIPGLEGGELQGGESVEFKLRSEDGDEGYPGTVDVSCIYTSGTQKAEDGKEIRVLAFEYQCELVKGADETVVNMTNHSYFNLSGAPTIEGTDVTLTTNLYLPVDDGGIPTGGPEPYPGITANKKFTLGATDPDVDDCFAFDLDPSSVPLDTRNSPLRLLVAASHPSTNIHLEVLSTDPGFQFYTGKYIDVPEVEHDGSKIAARGARSAFCVEPSRFVNAPNVDEWKGQVLLRKGGVYGSRHVYRAWCEKP